MSSNMTNKTFGGVACAETAPNIKSGTVKAKNNRKTMEFNIFTKNLLKK